MTGSRWLTPLVLSAGLLVASAEAEQDKAKQTQAAPKRAQLSPEKLFRHLSRSVFLVEVLGSDGKPIGTASAVAIAPDRLVTNAHVAKAGDNFRIHHGERVLSEVSVLAVDETRDLALLQVAGLTAQPVAVRRSGTIAIGQRVYAIGNPEGLELTFSEGIISGMRKTEDLTLLQTTAPISHGSSGGGLFDGEGRLVGITTASLAEGQNLNFAIAAEAVLGLASANRRTPSDSLTNTTFGDASIYGTFEYQETLELKKSCAYSNNSPCGYGTGVVAHLQPGARVKILHHEFSEKINDDIYKVRTIQGWEGWIDRIYVYSDQEFPQFKH